MSNTLRPCITCKQMKEDKEFKKGKYKSNKCIDCHREYKYKYKKLRREIGKGENYLDLLINKNRMEYMKMSKDIEVLRKLYNKYIELGYI